ncbi:Mitogen-activated protein kinase kinase kinase [Bertholletia excelsa]
MEWVRGEIVGRGSFGTVNLAKPKSQSSRFQFPMAVKSCAASNSASLVNEKSILEELCDCNEIIRCLGGGFSFENGEKLYNVFLEYASGGALVDRVKSSSEFRLAEHDVRRYTKSILEGLRYVHENGFVHCDLKLQNILLCSGEDGGDEVAKIADFGLAKKVGLKRGNKEVELRGTPLYMSPEMVAGGEQEAPADVWALGCMVAEMLSGGPAWRIGVGEEVPEIPEKLSAEGKDFLGKCFVKDPRERWTAEMLLRHPFVVDHDDDRDTVSFDRGTCEDCSTSPRGPLDFPEWEQFSEEVTLSTSTEYSSEYNTRSQIDFSSAADRLRRLVTDQIPNWHVSDSWVTVR